MTVCQQLGTASYWGTISKTTCLLASTLDWTSDECSIGPSVPPLELGPVESSSSFIVDESFVSVSSSAL